MKRKLGLALSAVSVVCCLGGCRDIGVSREDGSAGNGEILTNDNIPIKIVSAPQSRVTDTAYEYGDKVGIYVVNLDGDGTLKQSGNHLDNLGYSFNGREWVPEKEAFWKDDETPADFYCYFPHTESIMDIHSVPFAVKADQSGIADYKASEFLYGRTSEAKPSEEAVGIITNHVMSNLIIELIPGHGYTAESLARETVSITVTEVKMQAVIDLTTGKAEATGSAGNLIPHKENGYWRALVVPQEIKDRRLLKVSVGDRTYSLRQSITFLSNHKHTCTLTVNKTGEGVNIGIGKWETDGTDYGGTLE